jgi:predicted nucleic acid-binding protein
VKLYLDASALNRPFDDQSLPRNRVEAESVVLILALVEQKKVELISSSALVYETRMNPFIYRREYVASYLSMASIFVATNAGLLERAREIERRGVAPLDALHLASAEQAKAKWFITCDDRILRRGRRGRLPVAFNVSTPVEFVAERRIVDG